MKRSAIFFTSIFICLGAAGAMYGQGCDFDIVGTWKTAASEGTNAPLYRFTPDGTVTVLSRSGSGEASEMKPIGSATYKLDSPKTPKSIQFTTTNEGGVFAYGASSMEITQYDEASFTCVTRGSGPARWVRVDPNQYFIVLAARSKEFYDGSGSAFPILIKVAGRVSQVDAVGAYSVKGKRAFGTVPSETYKDFVREPRNDSEVMLRLEINAAQYERGLKILRTWDRRVREDALLYTTGTALNNVLLVKAVTETLNQCSEDIRLYKLNYLHPEDWIAEQNAPPFIPFAYFKELRRLNESRHVRDDKFQQASLVVASAPGQ